MLKYLFVFCALPAIVTLAQQLPGVPIPPIPKGIGSEAVIAVLFMIMLGASILIYLLSKGYLKLGTTEASDIKTLTDTVNLLATSLNTKLDAIIDKQSRILTSLELNTEQVKRFNESYHNRLIPTLSHQSLAMLKLSNLDDEAKLEKQRLRELDRKQQQRSDKTDKLDGSG